MWSASVPDGAATGFGGTIGVMGHRHITVETPRGRGRLVLDEPGGGPECVLLLGHGAGGGVDAFDLDLLARSLPAAGVTVVRYSQPWREAGRRVAESPSRLDEAWGPAVEVVTDTWAGIPLVVGGRSAGARVACRWAAEHDVAGVLALSFPLHPPGRPERTRIGELAAVAAPVLLLQGGSDPFGRPEELRAALAGTAQAGRRVLVEVAADAH